MDRQLGTTLGLATRYAEDYWKPYLTSFGTGPRLACIPHEYADLNFLQLNGHFGAVLGQFTML